MIKKIKLPCGEKCIFDRDDFDLIKYYHWYKNHDGYAVAGVWNKTKKRNDQIRMHRVIMGVDNTKVNIDHKNRNKLDNRKDNLRISNHSTNAANMKVRKDNLLGVKGVRKIKTRQGYSFQTRITRNGKVYYLGGHKTISEAAKTYNKAAQQLFGEFALLNDIGGK